MMTDNEEFWRELFEKGNPLHHGERTLFRAMPADPRCMFCLSPFDGLGGRLMPLSGRDRSHEDPRLCKACIEEGRERPGGAQLATLFADMRGSTTTAERIGDQAFSDLINRFFRVSSDVLIGSGALLGRLAGDEAIGYFVPGFVGAEYAQAALDSARDLLRATGHADDGGPWIPLGVGVHAGHGYVGLGGNPG